MKKEGEIPVIPNRYYEEGVEYRIMRKERAV